VCVPQLKVTTRQYGWGGETAEGFLHRMKNDCLRFQPTIATTCYGMNDFHYQFFDQATARSYRRNYTAVVRAFKEAGARVVLGSPGCLGKVPSWVVASHATLEQLNLSLCTLRNIDIDIAQTEGIRFADVFWPMFTSSFEARHKYGPNYSVPGWDGIHPNWAGHLVMAYAFLKSLGLDGQIGTITVDLAAKAARATDGHTIDHFADGQVTIVSRRYPFCARGEPNKDNSLRSGMTLVPFNQELNRLLLVVKGGAAASYTITWGRQSRTYSAAQLAAGVNLAADFPDNPFVESFNTVDRAVAAKQAYETHQVKDLLHGKQAQADLQAVATATEAERRPLAAAVQAALVPVTHSIKIEPR
jgi:lysophospholipase L1-like esterase